MILFGLFYYMIPRLTGREWASPMLIRVHFWCAAVGITVYFAALSIGGWWQGRMMNNPDVPFGRIVVYLQPHLFTRSLAGISLTVGHLAFALSFVMNLAGWGEARSGGPTFFVEPAAPQREATVAS
jgi:cytochrome c oxidase cbb3-type subunit I